MSDTPRSPTLPAASNLHGALIDFFDRPGKYQLSLREPAPVFAAVREVLQIAAGRQAGDAADGARVREAAVFFVRNALLYPGADHYTVFGLPQRSDAPDLKERYRLLMRLIHPDFAQAGQWPADAAVRVNRAYEVLSSAVLRRDYDDTLGRAPLPRPAAKRPVERPVAPPRRSELARGKLARTLAWMLGAFGVLVLLVAMFSKPEPVQLVQRANAPAAVVSAPPEASAASVTSNVVQGLNDALNEATNLLKTGALPPAEAPAQPAVPAVAPPASRHPEVRPVAVAVAAPRPAPPMRAVPAPAAPTAAMEFVPPQGSRNAAPPPHAAAMVRPEPIAPPPAPAREPAPAPVAPAIQSAAVPRAAPVALVSPTLTEVQPLLTQLLEKMETGSGEQMLRLLNADARGAASAQALQRQYDLLVRGVRPVRLAQVEFASETRGGVLAVTSRVRLHPGEPTIGSYGERFVVRAEFASRDGRVVLTSLSGVND